jgi:hypothetical protein
MIAEGIGQLPAAPHAQDTAAAGVARDRPIEVIHQPVEPAGGLLPGHGRGHQPHTAGDVEPDPSRRDHAAGINVGGPTPPMGKPYPQCTSGIVYDASTIPGSVATLTTCCNA